MEITIQLPNSVGDALAALAEKTGRTEDELIIEAVRDFLGDDDPATPHSFGLYADAELSGADSEDWLRANWRQS